MANSTRAALPRKRSTAIKPQGKKDFPLFGHKGSGYWAKKVRGKLVYFGKVADDPKGEAALNSWLEQRDDLLAGRTRRSRHGGLTVEDLCDLFLTAKQHLRDTGEIAPATYLDYFHTCERLVKELGMATLVDDLRSEHFDTLRAGMAKRWGIVRIGNEVTRVRVVFKYAFDAGHIDKPMRFGPIFKRPTKKALRKERAKKGERMFEAADLVRLINAASQPLQAMILLALNGGLGNSDVGNMPLSAIDLERGWIRYPRPKTGIERRFPLWPETIKALMDSINERPTPKSPEAKPLAFVTKYGRGWAKETHDNPVSREFRKLLDTLKLHRPGLSFYTLRHVFETIAGESKDQVAVDHIMGHARDDMASTYRERISDERLVAVAEHVRKWLFAKEPAESPA